MECTAPARKLVAMASSATQDAVLGRATTQVKPPRAARGRPQPMHTVPCLQVPGSASMRQWTRRGEATHARRREDTMWGSENWGEMVWSGVGALVPALEPTALVILVVVFLISAVVYARRARPSR